LLDGTIFKHLLYPISLGMAAFNVTGQENEAQRKLSALLKAHQQNRCQLDLFNIYLEESLLIQEHSIFPYGKPQCQAHCLCRRNLRGL